MAQTKPSSSVHQFPPGPPGRSGAAVGVVIPAHNEETLLGACLNSLRPFLDAGDPLLVVDAASTDRTADTARQAGVRVVTAVTASRGLAVERGVRELSALDVPLEVILIVHADMVLSPATRPALLQALRDHPGSPGGALGHRIEAEGAGFRLIEWGNRCRARFLQMPYGDQAQFFRPGVLSRLGGFPRQERLEDLELALRLRKAGPLLYLNLPVRITARHWERGIFSTTVRNWWTAWRYLARRRASVRVEIRSPAPSSGRRMKSTEIDPK